MMCSRAVLWCSLSALTISRQSSSTCFLFFMPPTLDNLLMSSSSWKRIQNWLRRRHNIINDSSLKIEQPLLYFTQDLQYGAIYWCISHSLIRFSISTRVAGKYKKLFLNLLNLLAKWLFKSKEPTHWNMSNHILLIGVVLISERLTKCLSS